ncbi:MAG: imidazole glycerol phosphate synthase subunit HisF [Candidatus Neomarinimicrobiota bacterium]
MLAKRIIPCLDIRDGQTVKGVNFINIRHAGDPVELGAAYAEQGADELVFLDITASVEKRGTFIALVKEIARQLNIPFTVGGGVRDVEDVARLLNAGADKITINTAAVNQPDLIGKIANRFGSQCVVVAIDTKHTAQGDIVFIHGGRTPTDRITQEWARQVTELGAGEILLTSMDHDGTKSGFALEITRELSEQLPIPVIASGGAGTLAHFAEVFREGKADAALAASVFHFGEIPIPVLKRYLKDNEIEVRL